MFHPYISHIQNVAGDGNCGFRAVAVSLGFDEDQWLYIRKQLLDELHNKYEVYANAFSYGIEELETSLSFFQTNAPRKHWMTMPLTGFLIANKFGVIVIFLTKRGSITIFPLWKGPEEFSYHQMITISLVYDNHYVMVQLEGDFPMTTIPAYLRRHKNSCVPRWEAVYKSRLELYQQLKPHDRKFENLCSFKIHHSGLFMKNRGVKYEYGAVDYYDFVDMDVFSIHELADMVRELDNQHSEPISFKFHIPGTQLDVGLLPLLTDGDVHVMSEFIKENKVLDIYVEHRQSTVNQILEDDIESEFGYTDSDDDETEDGIVGMPKKKRKRAQGKVVTTGKNLSRKYITVTCSKCGNKGHNQRSCKGQGGENDVRNDGIDALCSYFAALCSQMSNLLPNMVNMELALIQQNSQTKHLEEHPSAIKGFIFT
ncbi:hypothetical protein LXL04_032674 [Taraxacum kok-saghyz]